jgi:protein tyrosine/serine phosphatase
LLALLIPELSALPLKAFFRRFLPDRARFLEKPGDAAARRAAWLDMLILDVGILRLLWKNRARVGQGAMRMNQPFPGDIARAKAEGIRTVISARHDKRHGGHALEMEAAAAAGIRYIVLDQSPVFSREAPYRQSILEAVDVFRAAERDVLIHCKSGSDRAGFLSALWLIVMENVPVEEARKQLSLRFLHFSGSKTGRLDQVFTSYLQETAESGKPFLDWVREDYDHERINASHKPRIFGSLIDAILRRE